MATIAELAIKVSANISSATKNLQDIIGSVESVQKAADKAKPGMKQLTDAADGYLTMLDAVNKAQSNFGTDALGGAWDEQLKMLEGAEDGADRLKAAVEKLSDGVAGDILKMKPTMENLWQAQQDIKTLKELRDQLVAGGADVNILGNSINQAESNLAKMANEAAQLQLGMSKVQSVMYAINAAPFLVITSVFTDMLAGLKQFFSEWNEASGGMLGRIAQVAAVLTSVVFLYGVAITKAELLGMATAQWTTLLKSSLIAQSFMAVWAALDGTRVRILLTAAATGIATAATGAWTTAQWSLNAAMAANPIGLVAAGIIAVIAAVAALVYGITQLVTWWYSSADAVDENAEKIKQAEAAMKDFCNGLAEAADRYKELNSAAAEYHQANQSGAQKYLAELKKIDDVMNRQAGADAAMTAINRTNNDLVRQLEQAQADENEELIQSLQKRMSELDTERLNLAKEMQNSPAMDAADASAAKDAALQQYRESLGIVKTDAENLAAEMKKISEALAIGAVSQDEYYELYNKAREKFDPAIRAHIEAEKQAAEQVQKAAEEQKRVEEKLQQERIAAEQKVLQEKMNLADRFREMGKTEQDKYNETLTQLESVKGILTKDEYERALTEIEKKKPAAEDEPQSGETKIASTQSTANSALEYGTAAYFEKLRTGSDPALVESKRQTELQKQIAENTKKQNNANGVQINLIA